MKHRKQDFQSGSVLRLSPAVIVLIYLALGALWILTSDGIVNRISDDPGMITRLQTLKGWFYVATTALMLLWLIRRYGRTVVKITETLRDSEERYRIVSETATDAILTIDEDSTIVFANQAVERIFGYPDAEITGRPLTLLMPERYRSRHLDGIRRYRQTGRRSVSWRHVEFPGLHRSGQEIPLEISFAEYVKNGRHFFTGVIRDISERKHAEETIQYQAYHDLLTGLPNRAMFTDLLNHELSQMERAGKKLAVLFVDVDQFKNVNDSLGHAAGDLLLKDIAVRLKGGVRVFDTVARGGADDFMILLPLLEGPAEASAIVEKTMQTFREPFLVDNQEIRLSVSIGTSIYPEDGKSAETLIKNADIALHHAKDQGRNNYQFFNPTLNVRTLERIMFESRLRKAVESGELEVYFQPQQNIKTLRLTGAEALVRWNHPDLGLLKPARFIPLAEEIGLIIPIDQWVLKKACEQFAAWERAGIAPEYITVNLSARQFHQPGLPARIADVLRETRLRPGCLGIEITETLAMQDTELTARNLNSLYAMGVKLLVDDFGTGYSSLSYLKKLPIHKLKIDRSFITSLVSDQDYQAIIDAVIAMAHILRLTVVAEGVETKDQVAFLNSRNCDEMQGYVLSEPVPAGEFEKMLSRETAYKKAG